MRKPIYSFLFPGLLSLMGCDIVTKDVSPVMETSIYTVDDKPMIFNVATIAGGRNLTASLPTSEFGEFESLQDGKYLLFKPTAQFIGRNESVKVNLQDPGASQTKIQLNLRLNSLSDESECSGASGIYDYAQIHNNESLVLDLLDNDIFCNVGYNGGLIGEVSIEGVTTYDFMLNLGPGRKAELHYTPKPGFTGKVRIVYNLGINWLNPGQATEVSYEEIVKNPKKYFEAFTTALVEIDVVE